MNFCEMSEGEAEKLLEQAEVKMLENEKINYESFIENLFSK